MAAFWFHRNLVAFLLVTLFSAFSSVILTPDFIVLLMYKYTGFN